MNVALPTALADTDPTHWVRAMARGGEVPLALQAILDPKGSIPWHEVLLNPGVRFPGAANPSFWAAAKHHRLSGRLDARVISAALTRMGDGGIPGRASVNLTAESLQPGFASALSERARIARVAPERLCLELSEAEPLPATMPLITELRLLRDAGFQLALDDFGVGANHLGLLAHVQVDVLKVDASIVQAAARDDEGTGRARRVLDGILALSHALRLAVVLEGIEANAKDLALAQALQGVALQGWGIAPLQHLQ